MTADQKILPSSAPAAERLGRRSVAVVAGGVVAAGLVLGALGGWLWYQWWGPPNKGALYDTTQGIKWYDLSDQGIAHQFSGPAEYAVIAVLFGIVLGILAAVLGRRLELAALGALVVGSALAASFAFAVGTALSPPDPQQYATKANICHEEPCKEYPAAIEVSGWTPFLCWPIGALGGFSVSVVVMSWVEEFRRNQASRRVAGTWLDRGTTES